MAASDKLRNLAPTGECSPPIFWDEICRIKDPLSYVGTNADAQCGIWKLPTPPTGGGGAGMEVFDDVASLKAYDPTPLGDEALVYLKGYYAPDDDGGGIFRYDKASTATDDGGSVLTGVGAGAYLRQLGDGLPRAEFFGAKGDGVIGAHTNPGDWDGGVSGADDRDAITQCLEIYGRVVLRSKIYALGSTVGAVDKGDATPDSMVIEGESRNGSVLAFLDGNRAPDGRVQVPMVRSTDGSSRCELRNLTAYPNQFNFRNGAGPLAGTERRSLEVLESYAANTEVDNVLAYGYGRGTNRVAGTPDTGMHAEPFVFVGDAGSGKGSQTFRRIEFAGPAREYTAADTPGTEMPISEYPEVSHILAMNGEDVLVADCYWHDALRKDLKAANLHGVTTEGCKGVNVVRNLVERCDMDLYYSDNGVTEGLQVQDNVMRDGLGALLQMTNNGGAATYTNVEVTGNLVHLKRMAGSVHPGAFGVICGVSLANGDNVFDKLLVTNNVIHLPDSGDPAFTGWEPRALLFQADRQKPAPDTGLVGNVDAPAYLRVAVHDNVLDVPGMPWTTSDECVIRHLNHPLAILGTPKNIFSAGQATANANLQFVFWNNSTPDGKRITPWGFASAGVKVPDFVPPGTLDGANTEIGYDTDQRAYGHKAIEQGRTWTQAGDMNTITKGTLFNAFYLFGQGPTHATYPGPTIRSASFLLGMAADQTGAKKNWTVLLPLPQFDGQENVGNMNVVPAQVPIKMVFWRAGHVISIAGIADNSSANPYTVIKTYTVPADRPLVVWAYAEKQGRTGKPYWILAGDEDVAMGAGADGAIPAWKSGRLVASVLSDTGISTNSKGNFAPGTTVEWSLGTQALRWKGIYSQDIDLSRDAHVAGTVNCDKVRAARDVLALGNLSCAGTVAGESVTASRDLHVAGNTGLSGFLRLDATKGASALATDSNGHIIKGATAAATKFYDLTDTPGSADPAKPYLGSASKQLVVNAAETGLEFVAPPAAVVPKNNFLDLNDTPGTVPGYVGKGGQYVVIDAAGTKLEFAAAAPPAFNAVKLTVPPFNGGIGATYKTDAGVPNPVIVKVLMRVKNPSAPLPLPTELLSIGLDVGDTFDASAMMIQEENLATNEWGNAFQFSTRGTDIVFVRNIPNNANSQGVAFMTTSFDPANKNNGISDLFHPVPFDVTASHFDYYALVDNIVLP